MAEGTGAKNKGSGMIQFEDVNKQFTAVCQIECKKPDGTPDGGTGFIGRTSNNLLVLFTNHHVIPTPACAEEASFTFGCRDRENKGTEVTGDKLLDTQIWLTNQDKMGSLVGLDFTMMGVKENKIKELGIHPFDLAPSPVVENDQLVIPQHPLKEPVTADYERTPLCIALGPCKKILDFLMLYDCKTFHASSGSPVLKEVNGKLQVVGMHRGSLPGTYYNLSTIFSDILRYVDSDDKEAPKFAEKILLEFAGKVNWKPIEMFDLRKMLNPVRADWEQLAAILFKENQRALQGMVSGIKADCFHDDTNNKALPEAVEKWLVRTQRKDRTWQTLLNAAKRLGVKEEKEMSKYLVEHKIIASEEPKMHDVNQWSRDSICRTNWYQFATLLLPREEARAIQMNLKGDGVKECLEKLLDNWMDRTVDPTWAMIVDALKQLPQATEVWETILDEFKL